MTTALGFLMLGLAVALLLRRGWRVPPEWIVLVIGGVVVGFCLILIGTLQ